MNRHDIPFLRCSAITVRLTIIIFLSVIAFEASAVSDKQSRGDSGSKEQLSKVKNADMTLFDLYEEHKTKNPDKAAEYGAIFLGRLDTTANHPSIAEIAEFEQEYLENRKEEYARALHYGNIASRIYRNLGMKQKLTEQLLANSRLNIRLNHLDIALNDAYASFAANDSHTDKFLSEYYKLLGIIFQKAGDPALSSEYLRKSTHYAGKSGEMSTSTSVGNEGVLNFKTDTDKRRSLRLLQESVDKALAENDTLTICTKFLNLAGAYTTCDSIAAAELWCNRAERYARDNSSLGHLYMVRAQIKIRQGDTAGAIGELNKALVPYSALNFPGYRKNILENLSGLYSSTGDTINAYRCIAEQQAIEDADGGKSMIPNLYASSARFERELAHKDADRQLVKYVAVIICVAILLIAVIIVVMRRYIRNTMRKEMETVALQEEKDQNTAFKLKCMRCKQIIAEANDDLGKTIERNRSSRLVSELLSIRKTLSEISSESTISELTQYIQEFNSDMYSRLIHDFPDLTPNESRICVLVAKNMSTKQISDITRQSADAIKMARTRLRSKLGLTGQKISLVEFLNRYK